MRISDVTNRGRGGVPGVSGGRLGATQGEERGGTVTEDHRPIKDPTIAVLAPCYNEESPTPSVLPGYP